MANSFEGALADLGARGTFLAQKQYNENADTEKIRQATGLQALLTHMRQLQAQESVKGVLAGAGTQEEKINALQGIPGGMPLAHQMLQIGALQTAQAKSARETAFNQPANLAQFMTPGRPAIEVAPTTPNDDTGNVNPPVQMPATQGQLDFRRLLQGKLQAGLLDPMTFAKEQDALNKPIVLPQGSSLVTPSGGTVSAGTAKPMVEHNYPVGDNQVQPHISLDQGVTWNPIPGSQPSAKFARQVAPTINNLPSPSVHVVRDSKSSTGYAYEDFKTGMRRMDAPAPAEARNPRAEQLYRDYVSLPQVKEANDLEVKIQPLVDYMIDFKKTGKSVNANDAALAKAYLAVTTPVGSRAYSMDQRALAQMPNLGDRLGNMASSFFSGKDLTDQTRTEMFSYITQRYKALDAAREEHKSTITKRAKANLIPVDQIFGAPD